MVIYPHCNPPVPPHKASFTTYSQDERDRNIHGKVMATPQACHRTRVSHYKNWTCPGLCSQWTVFRIRLASGFSMVEKAPVQPQNSLSALPTFLSSRLYQRSGRTTSGRSGRMRRRESACPNKNQQSRSNIRGRWSFKDVITRSVSTETTTFNINAELEILK